MNQSLIARRNGPSPLWDLRREMDRWLNDTWGSLRSSAESLDYDWHPVCDVEEEGDHYLMSVEVPGIPRDQIKVECVDNRVTISGERGHETRKKDEGGRYLERSYGRFYRSFILPVGVDADKIEASYTDGVLRLYVPKSESAKPRKIKVLSENTGFFGKLLGQPSKEKESRVSDETRSGKIA